MYKNNQYVDKETIFEFRKNKKKNKNRKSQVNLKHLEERQQDRSVEQSSKRGERLTGEIIEL